MSENLPFLRRERRKRIARMEDLQLLQEYYALHIAPPPRVPAWMQRERGSYAAALAGEVRWRIALDAEGLASGR
jgi:hypothetical protein